MAKVNVGPTSAHPLAQRWNRWLAQRNFVRLPNVGRSLRWWNLRRLDDFGPMLDRATGQNDADSTNARYLGCKWRSAFQDIHHVSFSQ